MDPKGLMMMPTVPLSNEGEVPEITSVTFATTSDPVISVASIPRRGRFPTLLKKVTSQATLAESSDFATETETCPIVDSASRAVATSVADDCGEIREETAPPKDTLNEPPNKPEEVEDEDEDSRMSCCSALPVFVSQSTLYFATSLA